MSLIQIDLKRYWDLVQWEENLETPWWTEENKTQYRELLSYQVMMEREVFFQNRNQYIPLIQSFVEENLDPWQFHRFFRRFWRKTIDQGEELEQSLREKRESTFMTNDKAVEFCDCIHSIFDAGEQFIEIDNDQEKFQTRVTEIWAEIQNLLEET